MQTSSTRPQENDTAHSEDLTAYRNSPAEIARVDDLMRLIPSGLHTALDIGARDGHISKAIAQKVAKVTALDLECPQFSCPGVTTVKGDATSLNFPDKSIDLVFCAEVLEHLPGKALHLACAEMARVASSYVLVGVPYKQDLRQGKTTCCLCGATNPPWGHVNSFDEARLAALFPTLKMTAVSYVGTGAPGTNALSSKLMDTRVIRSVRIFRPRGAFIAAENYALRRGEAWPRKSRRERHLYLTVSRRFFCGRAATGFMCCFQSARKALAQSEQAKKTARQASGCAGRWKLTSLRWPCSPRPP